MTTNDSDVVVSPSCAVTTIVEVSPAIAWVVSINKVPLGLDDDMVADVMVSGFTGVVVPLVSGTAAIRPSVLVPVSIWPKMV